MRKLFLLTSLMLVFVSSALGQSRESLLRELLDLPAPAKNIEEIDNEKLDRPRSFYDNDKPPSDTAPIEDVFDYWKMLAARNSTSGPNPSAKNLQRLLDLAREDPAKLNSILNVLPTTDSASTTVLEIFNAFQNAEEIGDSWRDAVKKWLKFNSSAFVTELVSETRSVKDQNSYGSVLKEEELRALVRYGWDEAKPLLDRLASNGLNPRTATLAKVLQYEHAISQKDDQSINKLRQQLTAIAANKTYTAYSRDVAIEALSGSAWPGQDDWYLSLFEDETLNSPSDGYRGYSPLTTFSKKDPQKWLPRLVSLLGYKNRAVHNAAVQNLMEIETAESLRPLIPWLSDPNWADFDRSPGGRTSLMQIVSKFDLRESIPGLIWIIENDDDNAHWAARTLGEFKDERAGPPLRNALGRVKFEKYRKIIIAAMIECKGLTTDEQLRSLESFAKLTLDPKQLEKLTGRSDYSDDDPLPVGVSIGRFLSENTDAGEDLIRAAIEREKVLRKEDPPLAKALSAIISKWKGRLVDIELLSRIDDDDVGSEVIIGALARRRKLAERVPIELAVMRGKSGLSGALAACILEDAAGVRSAFLSDVLERTASAMACARLLRIPLPVEELGRMLDGKNKLLAFAAERYLESEDSLEARKLVWAKHPNEALILGARTTFDPIGNSDKLEYDSPLGRLISSVGRGFSFSSEFKELNKAETRLRNEIRSNPELVTIYALLPNNGSGQQIVRVYKDRATLTLEDDAARYKEKIISKEDLEAFFAALKELDIDNYYSKQVSCHHNCFAREFVSLSRAGGRRIFNGSAIFALGPLDLLSNFFQSGKFSTRYRFQDSIKDVTLLLEDSPLNPVLVWKDGDDLRVLISDEQERDRISDELRALDKTDEANDDLDYEQRQKLASARRSEREYEYYHWRELKDGILGKAVDEPAAAPFLNIRKSIPPMPNLNKGENLWQARWGTYQVTSAEDGEESGLWIVNRAEQRKIGSGWYGSESVVAGDWVVVAKTDTDWSAPNYLVRINLRTGQEKIVAIEPASDLNPVAFVAAHNKVLIYRGTATYSTLPPSVAEYFLLDVVTGKAEKVSGQFHPFFGQNHRRLQPTQIKDQYWATIHNRLRNETEIGIYDTKTFDFKPLFKLPEILITSDDMWVDEPSSRIYFVYNASWHISNLLSIPLSKTR